MPASRLLWGILAISLLMLPGAAAAVESGGLSVYPTGQAGSSWPWLQYHLAPGQTTTGSVTVDNRTSKTQDLLLYPVDAAPNGDGGFGMAPSYLRPSDAGQWLKLDTARLHLLPGTTQQVGFSFQVPPHAAVGPHYGGIVVQPVQPLAKTLSGLGLHIISRLGVRLYETVPGVQRPRLEITSLKHGLVTGRISFPASLRNSGNTILTPSGQLKVTNELGLTAANATFNLGRAIKPDQAAATTIATKLPSTWLPRHYHAKLTLTYGTSPHFLTTESTVGFWIGHPLVWLVTALVVVVGGILVVIL